MSTSADWAPSERANRVGWTVITAILAIDLAWLPFSSIVVVPSSLAVPVLMLAVLAMAARHYRSRRAENRLADALDGSGQVIGFTAVGALLSYLAATTALPFQDQTLHALDLAMGLDWLSYLKWVDARPLLGTVFTLSYSSILPQVVVLTVVLAFAGHGASMRKMVLAIMLSGIVTIAVSAVVPAMAMFVHLGLTPADYPNLSPAASFVHVNDMEALRAGTPFRLDLGKAEGIITFPSYHAALGLLLLLAAAEHRWLRWPFATLNLLMIASTPIDGGHYFSDVLAGLLIALACQAAAGQILRFGAKTSSSHLSVDIAPTPASAPVLSRM